MLDYYIVDAFTDTIFHGGQAGVVFLDKWTEDAMMQNIAGEFNVADTAFLIAREDGYDLRWFMPNGEISLNGHATLGAAYVIFHILKKDGEEIVFHTPSGILTAKRKEDMIELDFPEVLVHPYPLRQDMIDALGGSIPKECYMGENLLFVYADEEEIKKVHPDFEKMKQLSEGQGCFITAQGMYTDIVGRTFWPKMGVNEDPVCGNMHCNLTPFWTKRLHKNVLTSHQLSPRGASLEVESVGNRVKLRGKVALSMKGSMNIEF